MQFSIKINCDNSVSSIVYIQFQELMPAPPVIHACMEHVATITMVLAILALATMVPLDATVKQVLNVNI